MVKLVAFSIGTIFLGLMATVGLAAYTAAHPFGVGLVGDVYDGKLEQSRHVEPALVDRGSAPGPDDRAPRRRTLG